jgi:Protein of unknown function (DUF3300)
MKFIKQFSSVLILTCLVSGAAWPGFAYQTDQSSTPTPVVAAKQTPAQLQQLVAPIALYPDALVAQILAAATYPDQVVEADRWMQQHPGLKGDQLGQEVNQQPWDPSVKALTEFPAVLANMDKNLSWTSSLGDAYINQQQDVMDAVQTLRKSAKKAGNLKTTAQENVTQQGQTIVIAPVNPQVVYVPEYNPWIVYGTPLVAWPGWYWYPGLFVSTPGIAFGVGFPIGFFGGFGWGWGGWGFDWYHHSIIYNRNVYISHSRTFVNRNYYASRARGNFNRSGGFHGGNGFHGGGGFHGGDAHGASAFAGHSAQQHGFGFQGGHSGAFGGFNHGGVTRSYSMRGQSSFGGGFHGGGFHGGGGGGFHGGGGRR